MVCYESGFKIGEETKEKKLFYYFDYDERDTSINMGFQHFHFFYEIYVLLDQKAYHFIKGKPYELEFGDIVLLHPDLLHKTEYPSGEPSKRLIINFFFFPKHEGLAKYYGKLLSIFDPDVPIIRFDPILQKEIFLPLNDLFQSAQNREELIEIKAFNSLFDFIRRLFLYQSNNKYINRIKLNHAERKIYDIISYIHTYYQNNLTLNSIAKEFYMSPYYLSHQFKAVSGFNLNRYINRTRISNARSLLIESDATITDIAFQCGFKSISQFNRTFKKIVNLTPREYKNKHQTS
jgi:AraC-like DNA-binding protein